MRALILFCRLIVGSLFIVSGLIKANDPLGFSYKLEEYFAESALNMPFFEPWALGLAILACTAEIVLGFAILFGGRMKVATIAILGLTLFFGWLTAYTATCDPQATYTVMENGVAVEHSVTCVTDCGCFGDADDGSCGAANAASEPPNGSSTRTRHHHFIVIVARYAPVRSRSSAADEPGHRSPPHAGDGVRPRAADPR
ncbi:MAG TPA: DoxX family protein [Flavobacteriales bacterium]|nr:DoxX family protein [Flavobacteriales bacterium]